EVPGSGQADRWRRCALLPAPGLLPSHAIQEQLLELDQGRGHRRPEVPRRSHRSCQVALPGGQPAVLGARHAQPERLLLGLDGEPQVS
ncbi:hypothetical protein V5799_004660, partial [Amblyomma americanum]